MLFLKQPLIWPFLCDKSATTCQIDSYKVSNFNLKPDLCSRVKFETIECTAPPQQPHKRGTIFLGHPLLNEFHLNDKAKFCKTEYSSLIKTK